MRHLVFSLLTLAVAVMAAVAQPALVWDRTYGGSGYEFGAAVAADGAGGYWLGGTTLDFNTFQTNYVLYHTNAEGWTTQWLEFGGEGDQRLDAVQVLPGGDVLVVGIEPHPDLPDEHSAVTLHRLSSTGEERMSRIVAVDREVSRVIRSDDGGFYLIGLVPVNDESLWVLKLDAELQTVWSVTHGGQGDDDGGNGGVALPDGGLLVAGFTWTLGDVYGQKYGWLLRLDADGNAVWSRTFGYTGTSLGAVMRTIDGHMAITGGTDSGDLYFAVVDDNGEPLFQRFLGEPFRYEHGHVVYQGSDGSFMVAGISSMGVDLDLTTDMFLARFDAAGNNEYIARYGGDGMQVADVLVNPDGSLLFGGSSGNFNPGPLELWMARTDAGVLGVDRGDDRVALPTSPLLVSAWPNPFNNTVRVAVTLNRAGEVELRLHDLLGREVMRISEGGMTAGRHEFTVDGSALSSGTYLLRAVGPGGRAVAEKITLLR